jgi:hypothetical protein
MNEFYRFLCLFFFLPQESLLLRMLILLQFE